MRKGGRQCRVRLSELCAVLTLYKDKKEKHAVLVALNCCGDNDRCGSGQFVNAVQRCDEVCDVSCGK